MHPARARIEGLAPGLGGGPRGGHALAQRGQVVIAVAAPGQRDLLGQHGLRRAGPTGRPGRRRARGPAGPTSANGTATAPVHGADTATATAARPGQNQRAYRPRVIAAAARRACSVGCGHGDLAQHQQDVRAGRGGQQHLGAGHRGPRAEPRGEGQRRGRAGQHRLDRQVRRQQRALPQVARPGLGEQVRGVAGGGQGERQGQPGGHLLDAVLRRPASRAGTARPHAPYPPMTNAPRTSQLRQCGRVKIR